MDDFLHYALHNHKILTVENLRSNNLYRQLSKAIFLFVGAIVLLWLSYKMINVLLLLLFALVLSVAVNMPVTFLERKGMKRGWAAMLVFGGILLLFAAVILFIGPKIAGQVTVLVKNIPGYAIEISERVKSWFAYNPALQQQLTMEPSTVSNFFPSIPKTIIQVGDFSLSVLSQILVVIVFISMVGYSVANPRPLLELYLSSFAERKRDKAAIAFSRISFMIGGWMRSILIGGIINAVAATIFLQIMGVPGAFVWGALAFFTEFIPRIGFFIKALPPVLIALSFNGNTAIWVSVFYLACDELMADFIMPRVRSNTMKIHPVAILFAVMAMGAAFGFIGILLATPLTGMVKAYYEVFWENKYETNKLTEQRISLMMYPKGKPEKNTENTA